MARGGARPGGGRRKGSLNKATLDVVQKLAALGCDPIEGMARIATDPTASLELQGKMYSELAQYVAPKRKAVEVGNMPGETFKVDAVSRPPRQSREQWIKARETELGGVGSATRPAAGGD